MRLLTVEEILADLKKAGISLTRDNFIYYGKFGLLFAPDRKVKRRVKEGIIAYYAEEIVDRLKRIHELKKTGRSLNEIRVFLREDDAAKLLKAYKTVEVYLPGPSLSMDDAEAKVWRWHKEGYYQGRSNVVKELFDKLRVAEAVNIKDRRTFESLKEKLNQELEKGCRKIAKRVLGEELDFVTKRDREIDNLLTSFQEDGRELQDFLVENVYRHGWKKTEP